MTNDIVGGPRLQPFPRNLLQENVSHRADVPANVASPIEGDEFGNGGFQKSSGEQYGIRSLRKLPIGGQAANHIYPATRHFRCGGNRETACAFCRR